MAPNGWLAWQCNMPLCSVYELNARELRAYKKATPLDTPPG